MEKWLPMIVRMVLERISPAIAQAGDKLLDDLEQKANATANPWDDLFVDCLKFIVGKK